MSEKPNHEVNLINPPTKQVKMVKARVLLPIRLTHDSLVIEPGNEVEMTEDQAKEFCDREFTGMTTYFGKRECNDITAGPIKRRRAERIS